MDGLVIIWLLFSAVVGYTASSRGRSGFAYFLLSLILSPLLGLIIVLVLSNKIEEEKKELAQRREHERQLESIRAIAESKASTTSPAASAVSVAGELAKLAELRDRGVLTDEEFHAQKGLLLANKSA